MHPYGRISAPRRFQRRPRNFSVLKCVLVLFPLFCLSVVLYEFLYLQQLPPPPAFRNPKLRSVSQPQQQQRTTIILIANYRDTKRCSETLISIFTNAVRPDLLKISIFDQIYPEKGEIQCVDEYCAKVGPECRRMQIISTVINAADATGPTRARYETEKAITNEDFCLAIDSHLVFVKEWDKELISQWDSLDNPNAIITVYPKSTELIKRPDLVKKVQLMCVSRIESPEKDAMIQYDAPIFIEPIKKPRLMSQFAGGFNFGNCKQAKEVRNDPHTPFLFHGEEYSRATRLWTSGYDFYVPSKDICYHWYEKRKVIWERDWSKRFVVQQKARRRIRHVLNLPVSSNDFDRTDIENFSIGTKRTLDQWKDFSKIDPMAAFVKKDAKQFQNCGELKLVPY